MAPRTPEAIERKRARDRRYNAARTGGNSPAAAKWRAQKRHWHRMNRGVLPPIIRVAP